MQLEIIAHRGISAIAQGAVPKATAPENTLAAFIAAIQHQPDSIAQGAVPKAIEFDVQLSDGVMRIVTNSMIG
jgi:glycerophosphoryl diester phosphodiesterase